MNEIILEPKTTTYSGLCKNYNSFVIPRFQRLYSWKNKAIQNFYSSILENDAGYFIGTLVGYSDNFQDVGANLHIVDGQQRLTTINLMLIAIRRKLNQFVGISDAKKEIAIIDGLLKYLDIEQDCQVHRLHPGKEDLEKIFVDILEDRETSRVDSFQRVYLKNYSLLQNLISDYVNGDIVKCIDLSRKVRNLRFISILCRSEVDIQSIYEGLNSTGLPLSVSDLVKNKVISLTTANYKEVVEEKWDELEANFSKVDIGLLPKFLRHNWISQFGYINTKDLYQAIVDEFKKTDYTPQQYVTDLLDDSRVYLAIYGVSDFKSDLGNLFSSHKKILEILNNFQYLGNVQVYSVLLALIKRFRSTTDSMRPKVLYSNLKSLWNFCFRSQFVSINPSDYEKIFAEFCKILKNCQSDNIANRTKEEFKKLSKLVSNREQFIKYFCDDLSYNNDKKLIEVIFMEIFRSEQHEITLSDISIEHIVPQSPKKWGLNKGDVRDFVHNIGNLTLLHPRDNNSIARDDVFDKKYERYTKNPTFTLIRI